MVRAFVFAVVTFGIFGLVAHDTYAADGGRWYPFYGYRQPSYLAQPSFVFVQPSAPQVSTAYYTPVPGSTAPAQTVVPQYTYPQQPTTGGRWYPFYGNRRPNLE